jgi:3-methyladenine DNA glycosylase AlkC
MSTAPTPLPSATAQDASALKHIFDRARLQAIAGHALEVCPAFDRKRFLEICHDGLDQLSLMQRLHRVAGALHAALPGDLRADIATLRLLAPRMGRGFATLALCDYVAQYGLDDPAASLPALEFLTGFGSAEFAIRAFLRQDLPGTLAVMRRWASDPDEHVRRLASEGCRPRLPWASRIPALLADPGPVLPLLESLRSDPSLYVRKSVANHLNDIAKDHPGRVMSLLESWPLADDPHAAWIARQALRTLVKGGDKRALAILGAGAVAQVEVPDFSVTPAVLRLGDTLQVSVTLRSTSAAPSPPQRLVVDYTVHYVKAAGHSSAKVFKLKTLDLPAGASVTLQRRQVVRDFTTRVHHPGRHRVEVTVNGDVAAQGWFDLA